MTPTELLIPTYTQMLTALAAWLDKADGKYETLTSCLAPDMFPLATQVRFSCLQAYEGVAYLRGEEFPQVWHDLLEEGRPGRERPGTLAEVNTRIADAVTFLKGLGSDALDSGETRAVELKLPDGRIFDMTGAEYIRDWALPQFYFHVMTAYAILRQEGVPLGKADYVQHAFTYLRS